MPTPRKNRPRSRPRKGSISASSWCRKVDSESSTPARKAPMRHRQPAELHQERGAEDDQQGRGRHDLAGTGLGEDAEERVERARGRPRPAPPACRGRCRPRPSALPPCRRRPPARAGRRWPGAGRWPGLREAGSTRCRCAGSVAATPRSSMICMTIAVEVRTKPIAATKATGRAQAAERADAGEQRRRRRRPAGCRGRRSACAAPTAGSAASPGRR